MKSPVLNINDEGKINFLIQTIGVRSESNRLSLRLVAGIWCLAAFVFVQGYMSTPINFPLIIIIHYHECSLSTIETWKTQPSRQESRSYPSSTFSQSHPFFFLSFLLIGFFRSFGLLCIISFDDLLSFPKALGRGMKRISISYSSVLLPPFVVVVVVVVVVVLFCFVCLFFFGGGGFIYSRYGRKSGNYI